MNSDDITKEREEFEELLQTPGWHRFVRYAIDEYQGTGYYARMAAAVKSPDTMAPRVVHAACTEVLRLLQCVPDRVKELKGHTE